MKIEFTINTTRYESNARQTYFYATENVGTDKLMIKRRISKAEFEAAIETIKAYWMATMAITETREQMDEAWATKEGMQDLMDWYDAEIEAGLTEEDMQKAIAEAKLDAAAENPEISAEQFVKLVQEAEESIDTEAAEEIANEFAPAIMTISRECGSDVEIMETTKDRLISRDRFEFFRKPEWDKNGTKAFAMRDSLMPYALYLTKEQYETLFPSKKAPKAKKARKSKDIAYEGHGVTLTAKQVDFLHEMVDTMAWDGFDHPVYVDLLVDEIGGQFTGKPMTVGAMISTLCEKGLGERETTRRDNHKCTSFALTEMGQAVAIDLDL